MSARLILSSEFVSSGAANFSSSWASSKSSDLLDRKLASAAPKPAIKNRVLGIPGTIPIKIKTPETGSQALDRFICLLMCSPKSWVSETLVTIIAVAIANISEGIWATNPSPTDSKKYVLAASSIPKPCNHIPIIRPPKILIIKIRIPAIASPFTNFDAPSIEP